MSRGENSVRNQTQTSTAQTIAQGGGAGRLRAEHLAAAHAVVAGGDVPEAFNGDPVFAELVEQTRQTTRGQSHDLLPGL